jgi:hypothetical protein
MSIAGKLKILIRPRQDGHVVVVQDEVIEGSPVER